MVGLATTRRSRWRARQANDGAWVRNTDPVEEDSTGQTAGLVEVFYERLWNAWDDALVEQLLTDDFAFRGSLGQHSTGRDGWRAYRDIVRAGAPDFHNTIVELVVEGDRAAARVHYTGTHLGPLLGQPATGRRFGYDGAAFFHASAGRLSSVWVLGDLAALRDQLS